MLNLQVAQTFDSLSGNYHHHRKSLPLEVSDFIDQKLNPEGSIIRTARVLDLGCGTGKASLPLASRGLWVDGVDFSQNMLQKAKMTKVAYGNLPNLRFFVGNAENPPVPDSCYDAVTAFRSFHFFCEGMKVIKKKIRTGGFVFIIDKDDAQCEYGDGLTFIFRGKLPLVQIFRKEYSPKNVLEEAGFSSIQEQLFFGEEHLSLVQMINHVQTMSLWKLIGTTDQRQVIQFLSSHFPRGSVRKVFHKVTYGCLV